MVKFILKLAGFWFIHETFGRATLFAMKRYDCSYIQAVKLALTILDVMDSVGIEFGVGPKVENPTRIPRVRCKWIIPVFFFPEFIPESVRVLRKRLSGVMVNPRYYNVLRFWSLPVHIRWYVGNCMDKMEIDRFTLIEAFRPEDYGLR